MILIFFRFSSFIAIQIYMFFLFYYWVGARCADIAFSRWFIWIKNVFSERYRPFAIVECWIDCAICSRGVQLAFVDAQERKGSGWGAKQHAKKRLKKSKMDRSVAIYVNLFTCIDESKLNSISWTRFSSSKCYLWFHNFLENEIRKLRVFCSHKTLSPLPFLFARSKCTS